ncbi:MAG: hypothetical protein J6V72_15800 [Kiritimatiellae bacterium]|nr:hypothetical protein [Kiritimatiellia bacterium]
MELKKAKLSGTTSESGLGLQHEAAMRVEARYQAEEQRRRHRLQMERVKMLLLFLVLLGAAMGGGYYAWRKGFLGEPLARFGIFHEQKVDTSALSAIDEPAAGHASPPVREVASAAVEKIAKNIDAYNEAVGKFAGVSIAYWKDALPGDRPKKGDPDMDYTALVPDAQGGFNVLKIRLSGDNSMKIRRITQIHEVDVPRAEFNKMIEVTPFLVMRAGRAYYCSAGKPVRRTGFSVPKKGEDFNPSRLEFGPLYDLVPKSKIAKPPFKYDVFLDHKQFKKKLPVATVGFGEAVPHERFEGAARAAVDDDTVVAVLLGNCKVVYSLAQ